MECNIGLMKRLWIILPISFVLLGQSNNWDSTYPGVELLPTGEIVTTTYGHWVEGEKPFKISVCINLNELNPIQGAK